MPRNRAYNRIDEISEEILTPLIAPPKYHQKNERSYQLPPTPMHDTCKVAELVHAKRTARVRTPHSFGDIHIYLPPCWMDFRSTYAWLDIWTCVTYTHPLGLGLTASMTVSL